MPKKETSTATAAVRPKRKGKAPRGALGVRLKAKSAATPAQIRPSSPLPPSSPFASSSSQLPQDFLPVPTSDGVAESKSIEKPFYEADEVEDKRDFESEVYGMLDEGENVKEEVGLLSRNSDPFGFFALEAKLKVERIQRSTAVSKAPKAPLLPVVTRSLKVPRSPHKQRVGKRPVSTKSPSLPSSPSPAKPRRVTKQSYEATDISDDTENADDIDGGDLEDKRPKSKAGRGRNKKYRSDNSVSPEALARDLKALLPKRATRRRARSARAQVPRGGSPSDGPRPRKALKRAKEESDEDDVESEWATERQKRAEYFRKLEGYKVAKENVYVI
ncbi:hypothetical protein BT96DRAFT_913847 [Gymnopus androsaceus JB14]|uniref:Uncharacterized protein n=1 Tax=Gymnopus androsaceus JB14 TaxID=1447944 RepID=A0A6A4IDR6_9AGAR|nr:hypothetical protein BT96DRAFT_913847 [Gymnopus androsaceus JB14]